jgi:hypothetical protein
MLAMMFDDGDVWKTRSRSPCGDVLVAAGPVGDRAGQRMARALDYALLGFVNVAGVAGGVSSHAETGWKQGLNFTYVL